MNLSIVKYGDPVLRRKGARIETITPAVKELITAMFATMAEEQGIGLAAQQVGEALQLAIVDVRPVADRPSTLELNGAPADPNAFMPLVLINPELKPCADPVAGPEGCLSFPEIYADIKRPESITVSTLNGEGQRLEFKCGGLLARAIQHEVDHLNGILFIDRMDSADKRKLQADIDEVQADTKARLKLKAKR